MKIAFPLEKKERNANISWHFGKAACYAIYDTESKKLEFLDYPTDKTPAQMMIELKVDAVFAKGIGIKAMELLKDAGIKIFTSDAETLEEAINSLEKMKELKELCK